MRAPVFGAVHQAFAFRTTDVLHIVSGKRDDASTHVGRCVLAVLFGRCVDDVLKHCLLPTVVTVCKQAGGSSFLAQQRLENWLWFCR